MRILVTNDDGYNAKGIQTLTEILRPYGDLTLVAPKYHQSGMSMAVNLGFKPIAVKQLSEEPGLSRWYVDGTPACCVKFGIDNIFTDGAPDLVVSGINHGCNFGTAALYSGTIGAATEGALAGIPSIAVSLDSFSQDADFTPVVRYFPAILEQILALPKAEYGILYNINFPDSGSAPVKGIRTGRQGIMHWEREFQKFGIEEFMALGFTQEQFLLRQHPVQEEGEEIYMMVGDVVSDPRNRADADHLLVKEGYISIVAHNFDNTDEKELLRLRAAGFDQDFAQ